MKALTKKQKKLLWDWTKETGDDVGGLMFLAENLPDRLYWEVYNLNPFEDFNSAVEDYVVSILDQV